MNDDPLVAPAPELAEARRLHPAVWLALAAIVALGCALRVDQLDYPTVTYHNIKENEYLSQVRIYESEGLSLRRQAHFYEGWQDDPVVEAYVQVPVVPLLAWSSRGVFGRSLAAARAPIVLFSLGTIVLVFVLVRRLGGDALLALLSAALMAVLPESVYFGRSLMPDVPALFGLLGFFVLFARWVERPGAGVAAGAGLALAFAGWCKLSFLVPAVAVLAWVPWRRLLDDLRAGRFAPLLGFATFLLCPAVLFWIESRSVLLDQETGVSFLTNVHPFDRIDPVAFLRPSYWAHNGPTIRLYCQDNYTKAFALVALAGPLWLAFGSVPSLLRRHLVGMLGALAVFLAVFHDFVNAHSYYQLPFLGGFAMLCAGVLVWPFDWLARRSGRSALRFGALAPLLLNAGPTTATIDRHFSTQTFGLDVAGRFIAERAAPDERFVFFGSFPNAGVCTLAERFCIFVPPDVARLRQFEERFGSRFLYVPHRYLKTLQAHASWPYIAEHYAIAQVALKVDGTDRSLVHYVLERGAPYERLPLRGIDYVPAARYQVRGRSVEVLAATLPRD